MIGNPDYSPSPVHWGGQQFTDPGALARWLRARGASPAIWAIRHPGAAAQLGMPMPQGAPAAPPAQFVPGGFQGPGVGQPPQAGPLQPFPPQNVNPPGGMAGPGMPPPGPMEPVGLPEIQPQGVLEALGGFFRQPPRKRVAPRRGATPRRIGGR